MNNLVQCGDVNFSGGPRTGRARRHAEEGVSAAASWSSDHTEASQRAPTPISDHLHKRRTYAHERGIRGSGGKKQQSGDGRVGATNTKASAQIKIQCLY